MSLDDWCAHTPRTEQPPARKYQVLTPKFYRPVTAALLSSKAWERLFHFDTGVRRPVPCTRSETCPYCPHAPLRPTAYIACATGPDYRTCAILQLSESALWSFDRMLEAHRGQIRGLIVRTDRADARRQAKMRLMSEDEFAPLDQLPPEFDPRPTLELLWGFSAALYSRAHETPKKGRDAR